MSLFIFFEYKGAKDYCESIDGKYSVDIWKQKYVCNNESMVKYSNGWLLESGDPRDLSGMPKVLLP